MMGKARIYARNLLANWLGYGAMLAVALASSGATGEAMVRAPVFMFMINGIPP